MKSTFKLVVQYVISLAVAALLIWYLFKDINIKEILDKLKDANYLYITLSFCFLTISHISRSMRWRILYTPLGYEPKIVRSFLALMSGYFINLLIPRLGEVTRCGVLQKIEKIPAATSFGTVITERLVDLLSLLVLFIITFFLEFERLNHFFIDVFDQKFHTARDISSLLYSLLFIGILIIISCLLIYKNYKEALHQNKLFTKVYSLGRSVMEGVFSIRKIENKKGFIFHTLTIWVMYYCASYIVIFSLPQTQHLTFLAGFSILLMGSIGMAAPVQGGIGTFHIMVSSILVLYGVKQEDGLLFATLVHTSQYLFTFIVGAICFILTFQIKRKTTDRAYENSRQNS